MQHEIDSVRRRGYSVITGKQLEVDLVCVVLSLCRDQLLQAGTSMCQQMLSDAYPEHGAAGPTFSGVLDGGTIAAVKHICPFGAELGRLDRRAVWRGPSNNQLEAWVTR